MHSAEFFEGRIYVYRGGDGSRFLSDVHSFDVETLSWRKEDTIGESPPCRANHASALLKGCMYVFGGWNGSERFDDMYRLNLTTMVWERLHHSYSPLCLDRLPARAGVKMITLNEKIFLVTGEGTSPESYYLDVWLFNADQQGGRSYWEKCDVIRSKEPGQSR